MTSFLRQSENIREKEKTQEKSEILTSTPYKQLLENWKRKPVLQKISKIKMQCSKILNFGEEHLTGATTESVPKTLCSSPPHRATNQYSSYLNISLLVLWQNVWGRVDSVQQMQNAGSHRVHEKRIIWTKFNLWNLLIC